MYRKLKRKIDFYLGANAYVYRVFLVLFLLALALNIYNFGLSKSGLVFAGEESATDTIDSIISTSTINDLTSNDSIATTSIVGDSVGDVFSQISIPAQDDSSTTSSTTIDSASTSSEDDSVSTDSTSTDSDSTDSAATSTENGLTQNDSSTSTLDASTTDSDSGQSTSTENNSSTSTSDISNSDQSNSTSTDNTDISSSTNSDISTSTDISTSSTSTDQIQNTDTSTTSEPSSNSPNEVPVNPAVSENQTVVARVFSPILSGTFKSGVVPIIVSFNKAVYVSGKPQLLLSTGNPEITNADYRSGSGSGFLIFLYYIKKGNFSSALDYANSSALVLNGGSIKDKEGSDVVLSLPNPGSDGSLSGSSQILIKTI